METTTTIRIERPSDLVFGVVADMSLNPKWQGGMRRCTWTSEGPIAVGSTYDQEAGFLGKTITSSFRVEEFDPGRRIRIVSTKSTFPLDITREVVPDGGEACHVTAVVKGEPTGLLKLLSPLTDPMVRKSVAKDYDNLKAMIETDSLPPTN